MISLRLAAQEAAAARHRSRHSRAAHSDRARKVARLAPELPELPELPPAELQPVPAQALALVPMAEPRRAPARAAEQEPVWVRAQDRAETMRREGSARRRARR